MRTPIFRVTSDDYSDPSYPCAVSLQTLYDNADPAYDLVYTNSNPTAWTPRFILLERGCSVTVEGFTLTRIR